jgi:hypothetical protein
VVRCKIEEIARIDSLVASIMKQGVRNVLADALGATNPSLLPLLPEMKIGEDGKGKPWGFGTWTLYPNHVSVDLESPKTSGAALIKHVREAYWKREGIL